MADRVTPEFAEPLRATERMAVARRQTSFGRRSWFAVTLAAIFALHAALLAAVLLRDDPVATTAPQETAVEVVAEMPKAPEPPPAPAALPLPKPTAPQPEEKPATSAPRAQNDETVERDVGGSETRAPKATPAAPAAPATPEQPLPRAAREARLGEPGPDDGRREDAKPDPARPEEAKAEPREAEPHETDPRESEPNKAEATSSEDAGPATGEAADPKPDETSDAEALDKARDKPTPEPPRRPAALGRAETSKPLPPKPPARPAKLARLAMAVPQTIPQTTPMALPTAVDRLAGTSDLPDFVFAKPQRKRTRYKGGSEDNRYLAIVFAMVTQNQEPVLLPAGEWQVAVSFEVDGHGSLIGIGLTESSGSAAVDAAALDAVRRAAPFPPPPSGGNTGMTARMGSRQIRAAQRRERRDDPADER